MKELEWDNLMDNECPKCGRELSAFGGFRKCTGQIGKFQNNPVCTFIIRENKFNEIFNNLNFQEMVASDYHLERGSN